MRIKTEIGVTILLIFTMITAVTIVIGQNKLSKDFDIIEKSVQVNEKALME